MIQNKEPITTIIIDSIVGTESKCSILPFPFWLRDLRHVYFITYSQEDLQKFPTRKSFAEAIVKSFTTTTNSVVQRCCAKQSHKRSGVHYHMAIKLKETKCWLPSKKYLIDKWYIGALFLCAFKLLHGMEICILYGSLV